MIVRRCLTLTVPICLILSVKFGAVQAERWSRQVSNSEWIPLANPRATQTQAEQNSPTTGLLASGSAQLPQLPQLSLPPALQQQYQEQLMQLQKTQENIQKLLLLQQQLRAQQQLLQTQPFVPSGFSNADEDKQLHQVGLGSSQLADLASEDLVPPLPASEALPPVFPAQNFLPQRPRPPPPSKQEASHPPEFANLPGQEFKNGQLLQQGQNVGNVGQIEENQRQGAKQIKETVQASLVPQGESGNDEEEEVQLVYVPADTLAQRGQPKRGRGRKQYPYRQQQQQQQQPQQPQQHHESQGVDPLHEQDVFARQILQQIQMEREQKAQFLKEERMKELARLNEEQRALERKARLQQEALQREQELQRQREAEKKKKELERLEELAKQRELERIREAREKQRLEELERRRLAEIQAKEEKRRAEEAARQREAERLAALERQKALEIEQALKQQQILEKQRENEARLTAPENQNVQAQALPLIRDQQQQFHRQQLSEPPKQAKSKVRVRQRQRTQYQDQQNYRETTTTPSPNQPPLSVYMGTAASKTANVKVSDVLKILKDAKTIAVLDTVGPDTPQVFVGPTSLEPPVGYAKFDLPYLSSIDHNRVERKVDKLPFFVAPLSFDPPPGYSKIPFPAPHIGSVVVNTIDNTDPKDTEDQNPSPTPLIEPNSYLDGLDSGSESTTALYEPQTTINYSPEQSSNPKYEQTYTATPAPGYSASRFRFRQFYGDSKPASVISTSYYDDQRSTTRKHKYYDENPRTTELPVQSPKVETSVNHEEVSYATTPSFKEETIGLQDTSGQLALINQELAQQRETHGYNTGGQYNQQSSQASTGLSNSFDGEITAGDINDVRAPAGPTQYSLPAELPAISPHLPGLVNSLLDKNEAKLQASTTTSTTSTTTTTTTTTQRTPTTTYRPRGRQRSRVSTTRPRTTTQAPSSRTNVDRSRRPYNRSRSRFSTTTEEYRESAYEPTKSRIPETTLRYNVEHRRPTSRTHKYKSRDKTSQQSEVLGHTQNSQTQQSYDTVPNVDPNSPTSNAYLHPTGSDAGLRQLDSSSGLNDYTQENYPSTTVSTTENYPPLRDVTVNHGSALVSEDYSRSQNYPQNIQEDPRYRSNYDQSTLEQTGLEKSPVNGFNYQAQNEEPLDQGILQRPKDYQLDGKAENSDYELATTPDPRLRTQEEQRYSSIYDVNVPQTQPEYSLTAQDNLHHGESEKIQTGVADGDPNEQPIFVPLPENKQEDYELPVSSTELPLSDITTETTTTSTTPVVIRQRIRGRVSSRLHHEPSVQTRNRGSQDEYVRFNAVNQESVRTSPNRQRIRSRSRSPNHGSQVQTDGNEYIKIHVAQQQRHIVTTTPAPTTTTTTTVRPTEEDIDYGFIRPPNFRPVHPVESRYPQPVTYRPPLPEVPQQSLLPNDETAVESSPPQTQLLKNRQKYQPTPSRRPPSKPTTLPPPTTTPEIITTTERIPVATILPDDAIYAVKSKSRPDEIKQTRTRTRVRRPVRKRITTTSTTESVLEAHNELPLDENYPPIRPQSVTTEQQQPLYDDNYDNGAGFPVGAARNPTGHQFYETSSENYPPEFVLNFGNYPAQPIQRDEYDQTQLASSSPRRYTQSSRSRPVSEDDRSTTVDIYGAESQWSTKLTRTSFQPSFAVNRVPGEASKSNNWYHEPSKDDSPPEIITAAPEVSSVTLVVSSDDKKVEETQRANEDESMLIGTSIFGRKTTVQDHTEKMNATEVTTDMPAVKERNGSEAEVERNADSWLMDRVENSTEHQNIDLLKNAKKSDSPTVGKKTARRRRVRVRVRPAVDDFVTAESQHFNSALNGLFRDQYKYEPVRESKHPVAVSGKSPEKTVLQDFLTEILKSDETTKPTTTEVPEIAWTMSPAITTPMVIPDDVETTTEIQITTMPTTYKPEETTIADLSYEHFFSKLIRPSQDNKKTNDKGKEKSEKKINNEEKEQKTWEPSKKRTQNLVQNTFNSGSITENDRTKDNTVNNSNDDSETFKNDEERNNDKKDLKIDDEIEVPRERNEENMSEFPEYKEDLKDENNYAHPKNHRAKWSEVRYPSAFDRSKASTWNHDQKTNTGSSATSIPGLVTKNEGDTSVRTLSDYVQAIFDTMKSAEEETTDANTENPEELMTTIQPPLSETELPIYSNHEQEKAATKDTEVKREETTTQTSFEETQTTRNFNENGKETTQVTESTMDIDLENATTLGKIDTTLDTTTSSSTEHSVTDLPLATTLKPSSVSSSSNSTESILGKVLRTSTTTRISHMTEICYRGRCVMTRPSRDDRFR